MHLITVEGNVQTHATAAINYILLRLTGGFYRQYKTGSSHLLVFFEQCLLDVRVFQVLFSY